MVSDIVWKFCRSRTRLLHQFSMHLGARRLRPILIPYSKTGGYSPQPLDNCCAPRMRADPDSTSLHPATAAFRSGPSARHDLVHHRIELPHLATINILRCTEFCIGRLRRKSAIAATEPMMPTHMSRWMLRRESRSIACGVLEMTHRRIHTALESRCRIIRIWQLRVSIQTGPKSLRIVLRPPAQVFRFRIVPPAFVIR